KADSQAAILVHGRGVQAIEALYKAEGDVAKARAMLPPKPAGLLPATAETIESGVPKKGTPDLPEKTETKGKPETKPVPEPKPEAKPEIKPPPVNAEGRFDFTGRTNKELARDSVSKPYAGETAMQAETRAAQAQAEVVSKLPGLKPCFVAGTQVLNPDGPTAIEKLEVGNQVIVMDPASPASVSVQEILEVFRGSTSRLCQLSLGGRSIRVTPNHRFFVVGAGWKQAGELNAGDLLLTPSGEPIIIDAVEQQHLTQVVSTFNLRVAEIPTYFVGWPTSVLAHNNGPDFNRTLWWLLDKRAKFR